MNLLCYVQYGRYNMCVEPEHTIETSFICHYYLTKYIEHKSLKTCPCEGKLLSSV